MSDQATKLRGIVEAARTGDTDSVNRLVTVLPPSMPTGVMSYGPPPPRRRSDRRVPERGVRLAHAIAVCSGKGGVGKSNLAVNLAVSMSRLGLKVCLLDADLGMANADLLCNVSPRVTLEHVVTGRCALARALLLAPGGFRLIPGASGVAGMANLDARRRQALLEQLSALDRVADIILIDCGAGISANVLGFAAAANTVLVVTTSEPTAMTDGYGMIKTLIRQVPQANVEIVVNMAGSMEEAKEVFDRLNRVTQMFLKRSLVFGGAIPADPLVPEAVRQRVPFVLYAPDGAATRMVSSLGRRLSGVDDDEACAGRSNGFFARLATWLGAGKNVKETVDSS